MMSQMVLRFPESQEEAVFGLCKGDTDFTSWQQPVMEPYRFLTCDEGMEERAKEKRAVFEGE